jgi:hypothetical protein
MGVAISVISGLAPAATAAVDPVFTPTSEPAATDQSDLASDRGGVDPTAVERVDLRTANSRTFERDGHFVTEFFTDAQFYRPQGSTRWDQIDLTLKPTSREGFVAAVDKAPARIAMAATDAPGGFLKLSGGGFDINFGLPAGAAAGRGASTPQVMEDGLFAEYRDFMPGGISLRVFPKSDGFNTFLVVPARPSGNTFSLAIDAPGLELVSAKDGSVQFLAPGGRSVGRIPRPFVVDSSEVEGRGGGLYSEAVSMSLASGNGSTHVLTFTVYV